MIFSVSEIFLIEWLESKMNLVPGKTCVLVSKTLGGGARIKIVKIPPIFNDHP